jgi:hypothetical protein
LGSGEVGESDLDNYKIIQQDDFRGGCFQEIFDDKSMVSALDMLAYNPVDKLLHPTPAPASFFASLPTGWLLSGFRSGASYKGIFYTFFALNSSGNKCWFGKLVNGTWTTIKNDFSYYITDMCTFNGYLYVASPGANLYRYDGTNWVTGVSGTSFRQICTFNNKLYGIGDPGDGTNSYLYSFDGTTSTQVGIVGDKSYSASDMFVFNHRLYIPKDDGLYVYDGVQISCIIDSKNNPTGFEFCTVHDGFIYYIQDGKMYRFNGSTIECIWDTVQSRTVSGLVSAAGYLWALTSAPSGYMVSGGKGGGTYPVNSAVLFRYNGYGWSTYYNTNGAAFVGEGLGGLIYDPIAEKIYFSTAGVTTTGDARCFALQPDIALDTGTVTNTGTLLSSIFNCNFDNIDKYLDSVSVDTENMVAGDLITVYYRVFDGYTWSSFNQLGTISSTSGNKVSVMDTLLSSVFKRIQFKITLTRVTASICAIRGYSAKYFLSPDFKNEWNLSVLCTGTSDNPADLLNGSAQTIFATSLRENIYAARRLDTPVNFEDIDYTLLNGALVQNLNVEQLIGDTSRSGVFQSYEQTFKPAQSGNVSMLCVKAAEENGDGVGFIRLYNGATPLTDEIPLVSLDADGWANVTLPTPAAVVAGTTYTIVVGQTGGAGDILRWYSSSTNVYADGAASVGGTPQTWDFAFKVISADSVTAITVDTTDLYAPAGLIKIDDEIIKYTGKTATQFTGVTRGMFSTIKAAHLDNAIINSLYRVLIEIQDEQVYLPADTSSTVTSMSESVISLSIKEV